MSIRQFINKQRAKFYNKVTDYHLVKQISVAVVIVFLSLLLIEVIIATLFGPTDYAIWTHMISDLGGRRHTPVPILYDITCVIGGIFTIPLTFYIENLMAPLPTKRNIGNQHYSRLRFRLSSNAFFFSILGNLAYIGVGIWSEDRNYDLLDFAGYHDVFSFFSFAGFSLGAFFIGWIVVLYDTKINKIFGIYGIFCPITMLILFLVTMEAFWEWMLLFSILLWIIPLALTIFLKSEFAP
ncbi:MAG: hypothetical protein ACFE8L_13530 [Candidatus Hodarchaeota archaeon]